MAYLRQYTNDRGALANLRGALSDARRQRAWPLLGGFASAIGNPAYETVAALWAGDPEAATEAESNLGDTLRRLGAEHNSFEGRLKRLLTCDQDEIAARATPVVRAAQAKGVAVNYTRLLSDLLWWNDRVKVEWAKAFWEAPDEDAGINPAVVDLASAAVAPVTEVQP
jgi:CRISPR system Cascade subunit CasB